MKYLKNLAMLSVLLLSSQINSEVRAEKMNAPLAFLFVIEGPQIFTITSNLNLILNQETFSVMNVTNENEMIFENTLQIEPWMTDYHWYEGNDMLLLEPKLQLEDWMENINWINNEVKFKESELTLEKWMENPDSWTEPSM